MAFWLLVSVVIVGSHADQITSSVEEKGSLLQTIAMQLPRTPKAPGPYVECIAMDCRQSQH